ncbi:DUF5701 family protein [Mycobacterium sp. NPDC050551]|uniref:DUF5701 family protein n=1 Tax=Mycobacterium sp. NPDC050551 TaxID=3155407 RepID=UPI003419D7EC
MPTLTATLPNPRVQAERLIAVGVHELAGLPADALREAAERAGGDGVLLAVDPVRLPPSVLAPLLRRRDKAGFVVTDMADVDEFVPLTTAIPPGGPLYVVRDVDRGDEMANWSPDEALPAIEAAGRTPLTLAEGLHWLIQQPDALQRGRCFMTVGSRRRKPDGKLDARTPALWISNGTGRDGPGRRDAPKVGWCWAGNRHTWLGFASAAGRSVL